MIVYSIGIDPGLSGALVLLSKSNNVIKLEDVYQMPLTTEGSVHVEAIANELLEWNTIYGECFVTIEKQLAFQSKGAAGSYVIGRGVGILEGICSALHIPYKLVNAKDWQRFYKDTQVSIPNDIQQLKIKDTKKLSLAICKELFPDAKIQTKRGRYLDGVSDATLIANWALQ